MFAVARLTRQGEAILVSELGPAEPDGRALQGARHGTAGFEKRSQMTI
jgi:hypothetical protein